MDKSAKAYSLEYLKTKGIDPTVFDKIFYENLLEQSDGYFESYILIHNGSHVDSLLLKKPLLTESGIDKKGEDGSPNFSVCGKISNRTTLSTSDEKFLLVDYLLQKHLIYTTDSNKIERCDLNPFEIEENTSIYRQAIIDLGYSLAITDSIRAVLVQIGKGKPKLLSALAGSNTNFQCIVDFPFAFKDTTGIGVKSFTFIQKQSGVVAGVLKSPDHYPIDVSRDYGVFTNFGGRFQKDQIFLPLMKYEGNFKKGDYLLAAFKKNPDSFFYSFVRYLDFKMPQNIEYSVANIGFTESTAFLNLYPTFFSFIDMRSHTIDLNLDNNQKFLLYSVNFKEGNPGKYNLCYSLDDTLYVSVYEVKTNKNKVMNSTKITDEEMPIMLNDIVFVLDKNSPNLPYRTLSY